MISMDYNYEDNKKKMGSRIKSLRIGKEESQAELAKAIHSTQNSISKIENGNMNLTLENLLAIADHYHVSLDFLLKGANDSTLDILNKYITLKYEYFSENNDTQYHCPILKMDSSFFDYLLEASNAKEHCSNKKIITAWLNELSDIFYEQTKHNKSNIYEFFPVPTNLIINNNGKTTDPDSDRLLEKIEKYFQQKKASTEEGEAF